MDRMLAVGTRTNIEDAAFRTVSVRGSAAIRQDPRKSLNLAEREGLLGAARLAPSGPTFGCYIEKGLEPSYHDAALLEAH